MLTKILYLILRKLSRWMLARYSPTIVAVTGSIGKTSTKNAIDIVLRAAFPVRKSFKSYNNQIGVPLTILGFTTPGKSIFGWFKIFIVSLYRIVYQSNYPQILILEMGADRKGDLRYLTSFVPPNIAVLTGVGTSHLEYFETRKELIKEKRTLINALRRDGTAVLNFDNRASQKIGLESQREVIFYGLKKGANFRALGLKFSPQGMSFKVETGGNTLPAQIPALGRSQVYSALAALAVGSAFKLNLVESVKALKGFQGERGRCQLLKGRKSTVIIDDSYNSAPESVELALETLQRIEAKGRRVVILGDMLELGKGSDQAHIEVGCQTAKAVDLIILVGPNAKMIKKGAEAIKKEHIYWFKNYQALNKKLLPFIRKGDIILVKASQGIRLEKVVEKLLSSELNPKEVLVRQAKEWQGVE